LFGAGTGLSDADREFAKLIAGGNTQVTEAALRRILDINERAARGVIALHNERAKGVKTNIPPCC
jgi:formyltetrahydrofolate synthetase